MFDDINDDADADANSWWSTELVCISITVWKGIYSRLFD